MYKGYVNSYDTSLECLQELSGNTKLQSFFRSVKEEKDKLDIMS